MKRPNLAFLLAVAGVLLAPPMAQGLSVTPTDLTFSAAGTGGVATGTIHVQALRSGAPPGATLLDGTPGASDPTLVFDITLDPTSAPIQYVDVIAVSTSLASGINPTGIGWVPGNGTSSEPDGLVDPSAGMSVVVHQSSYSGPLADSASTFKPASRRTSSSSPGASSQWEA